MPKRTSAAESSVVRIVIVTMDSHIASAVERARARLARDLPGLDLVMHAAADWSHDSTALERCRADIARGDVIVVTMLFMEEHFRPVLDALAARRDECDAMVCAMCAGEVVRLTRLGRFNMSAEAVGAISWLKRLRGNRAETGSSGHGQMKMLRRIPQILRFIPGTAQDVRAYFLTLQYWLAGSRDNISGMVRFLVDRYASGPRRALRGTLRPPAPVDYPDIGVYHPRLKGRLSASAGELPRAGERGTVGLLLMRSYLLAGNTAHYDGVIDALEARGLSVIPAFATGLDARPAVESYFMSAGEPAVDAIVSLTGFSLVGGPAYNDARAAEEALARLGVPYLAAHPVEFQTLEDWERSERGLLPIEATMMVALPELDGATGPTVFGGRGGVSGPGTRDMQSHPERTATLAARVARMVALRRTPRAQRKIAVVIFNFPPNSGAIGTAAYLSVFASLHRTLLALKEAGYDVDCPATVDALRESLIVGNAQRFGATANVHARIRTDDHVRREQWLPEIEAQWGPAPGRHQSDGASLFVLGARFGNVFVGVQPAFGYEGDPMKLLFERGFAPTHAFAAFYRWMREDFAADAYLHFGMHGALEFMPGKQVGLSAACWPDRLLGDVPNFYLYAANNPSEGALARRRSAATLLSYLTPAVTHAGLYRGLLDLKTSVDRWRALPPGADSERDTLETLIQAQAAAVELAHAEPAWDDEASAQIARLTQAMLELEYTLIPSGLHVIGEPHSTGERVELLLAMAHAAHGEQPPRAAVEAIVNGETPQEALAHAGVAAAPRLLSVLDSLSSTARLLAVDHELPAIVRALDGAYVRPAPGGDLLRTPAILPTGRNIHGLDPYRMPSAYAVADGERQAMRLLERTANDGSAPPESIGLVLWGSDNIKNEGAPIAQALALIGAKPRFDSYGRLAGASLVPLDELSRPRIDVVITLSGIFRDLLPLQVKLLAEAAYLAAAADEPLERNFIRKHALEYQRTHHCDLETAALRVFSNADGAYGSSVNHLVDNGRWSNEDELAEAYTRRKSFAYSRNGNACAQPELLSAMLAGVELTYQNIESVELGVTSIDHYFDTLGGLSRAVHRARGAAPSCYVGDQTCGEGTVRALSEQVALETRTRVLNPHWYEPMLRHGYEGVRHIEAHVTNTMGWSATTGQVAPWIYREISRTFVLDPEMRERLAALNPTASAQVTNRLLEAHERRYWSPDEATLEALRRAGEELEDRLEGIDMRAAA